MLNVIIKRAARGFVAGGLANIAAVLAANQFQVKSLADLQALGFAILTGFLVGGLLALDKLIRYESEPQSTPES